MQHPLFEGICRQLIGEQISVFRAMFMNKPAHQGTVLPYHQDGGTQWGLDRERFITIWTALDDATVENGCVEIVPGTTGSAVTSTPHHQPEQEAEHCDPRRACSRRPKPARPSCSTIPAHRSGVNTIERPRRAFSVVYMDGATRRAKDGATFPMVFGEGALAVG